MLQQLLKKIETDSLAIKEERDKRSNAIANSDLIEKAVDLVIAGKETKTMFIKLFADLELEYEDEYNSTAELAERVALQAIDAINKNT